MFIISRTALFKKQLGKIKDKDLVSLIERKIADILKWISRGKTKLDIKRIDSKKIKDNSVFRLKVKKYRIFFIIEKDKNIINVILVSVRKRDDNTYKSKK